MIRMVSVKLLKCFCESRRSQAFYTKCLDENSSEEETDFLTNLIQESAKTSNEIKQFCQSVNTERN